MAYIIQQRRDTLANWNSINPVLADSELGFILDKDETGKQKSSLYKIGDGRTAWKDLPLFGFGGNVYDDFRGDDLTTSVPTRQAVLDKFTALNTQLESDFSAVNNELENRLLVSQLVEELGIGDVELTEELAEQLRQQIVSRMKLIEEFDAVWEKVNNLDELLESDIATLEVVSTQFNTFKTQTNETLTSHDELLTSHTEQLDAHDKFINGWDEEVTTEETDPETGEPIIETVHHNGVDEKIDVAKAEIQTNVDNVDAKIESLRAEFEAKHNILSEVDFAAIKDFTPYAEGTLFYTYAAQS